VAAAALNNENKNNKLGARSLELLIFQAFFHATSTLNFNIDSQKSL
jgi:hypothetical protein